MPASIKWSNINLYISQLEPKKIVATKPNPTSPGEAQLVSRIYLRAKDDINHCQESPLYLTRKPNYTVCPKKKGIDKKLSVGAAHDFNLQFLNLFGFSIPVSFVWYII